MSAIGLAVGDTKKKTKGELWLLLSLWATFVLCFFFFFPHEHDYYFEQEFLN
jgi:hypothetical protein